MESSPSENIIESTKLQIDILMAEYQAVRGLVGKHAEWHAQLDALALAGLGASISLVLVVLDHDPNLVGVVLLLPVLFLAIMYAQLRQERLREISAIYIDAELRPKLTRLLALISSEKMNVLGYEGYLSRKNWAKSFWLEWLATLSHSAVSLASGTGIIVFFLYVRLFVATNPTWRGYEVVLLVINGLIILADLAIAFLVARIRYNYLSRAHYIKPDLAKENQG